MDPLDGEGLFAVQRGGDHLGHDGLRMAREKGQKFAAHVPAGAENGGAHEQRGRAQLACDLSFFRVRWPEVNFSF